MSREPLKQHGQLLAPEAEPPGRFVDGKWQGDLDWCTQHGPAVVQWSIGVPSYVWNARTPDNARVHVQGRQPASGLFRIDADNAVVNGQIRIDVDDVAFSIVDDLPDLQIEEELRPLFERLRSDEAFVTDLESPAVAGALYSVIENEEFVGENGAIFAFGQRSAAHFVVALRDAGEDYLDFAWGRGPGFAASDVERVRAHFARLLIAPREE